MYRFYHPQLASLLSAAAPILSEPGLSAPTVELTKDESHHAFKVLRLSPGQTIGLFDGAGTTATANIVNLASRVNVHITSAQSHPVPAKRLTIASAIPKGPRADAMIDQLSQTGCDEVIPLRSARSIVDPRDAKLERFQRGCVESAKQCGRAHLMTIAPSMSLHELLRSSEHDLKLIGLPEATSVLSRETVASARHILILIGPEGGWLDEEIHDAKEAGCIAWCFGPHVMRIETAAIAAAALVRYLATK